MIKAEQLHKAFGAKVAVQDVSFSARDGEITGLLGPNGAGKTTTLRMLYTLLRPDRGRITVDGLDAALLPIEVRRRLGVLPDARGLYKRLTARENIAYFAQLHGLDAELIRQRSDALSRASRRASASRPPSRAHWCTIRGTSCSMSQAMGWMCSRPAACATSCGS
jgi:sodium transport system ATP-binding protein